MMLCSKCRKLFTRQDNKQRHEVTCGTRKTYNCMHCTKKFSRGDVLSKHVKQMHRSVDQQQTRTAEENTDKASVKYQQHIEPVHGLSEEEEDEHLSEVGIEDKF